MSYRPFNPNYEKKRILEEVCSRDIYHLMHFTSFSNLESILDNGIVPRALFDQEGIEASVNDQGRFDYQDDCTCLSIEFPNQFLFYRFRKMDESNHFCILQLDFRAMLDDDFPFYFIPENAAIKKYSSRLRSNASEFTTYSAFCELFAEERQQYKDGATINREGLESFLPTDVQAEVLTTRTIGSEYIEAIIFKDEDECDECYNMCISGWNDDEFCEKAQIDKSFFGFRDSKNWEPR